MGALSNCSSRFEHCPLLNPTNSAVWVVLVDGKWDAGPDLNFAVHLGGLHVLNVVFLLMSKKKKLKEKEKCVYTVFMMLGGKGKKNGAVECASIGTNQPQYFFLVCLLASRRWCLIKVLGNYYQKLWLVITAVRILWPNIYHLKHNINNSHNAGQLSREREMGEEREWERGCTSWRGKAWTVVITWFIFQPSERVDNICVSSLSWQWKTRYTDFVSVPKC